MGYHRATRVNIRSVGWKRGRWHFNKLPAAPLAKSVEQVLGLGVDDDASHKSFTSLVLFGHIPGVPA